jgi:hypothetical protein
MERTERQDLSKSAFGLAKTMRAAVADKNISKYRDFIKILKPDTGIVFLDAIPV